MDVLVFPAASRPSMSSRISRDPKILPIIFDIWLPMVVLVAAIAACAWKIGNSALRRQCGSRLGLVWMKSDCVAAYVEVLRHKILARGSVLSDYKRRSCAKMQK